jgi:hypothetical protein
VQHILQARSYLQAGPQLELAHTARPFLEWTIFGCLHTKSKALKGHALSCLVIVHHIESHAQRQRTSNVPQHNQSRQQQYSVTKALL